MTLSVLIMFFCNIVLVAALIWMSFKYRKLMKEFIELYDKYRRVANPYPHHYDPELVL